MDEKIKFIELPCFYKSDEGIDYGALGIEVEDPLEEADIFPTMVNINAIEQFCPSNIEGATSIQFVGGERVLFAIEYEELKNII